MNEEENKDRIGKLNEELYNQGAPEVNKIIRRSVVEENTEKPNEVPNQWGKKADPGVMDKALGWTKQEQPIFRKILWFALGFFVLCLALATFLYLRGVNTVSSDKIDINFSAPLSVSASNPFSLDIAVLNKNNSDLVDADILVDYPDGTRAVSDNTKTFVTDLIPVGQIKKDELVKKRSEAILFGQEGEKKSVKVTLHYKVPGSSSVFEKKTEYQVLISSAPVTVVVDSVRELNSNQEITFNVKVTSNSASVLRNIAIIPNYPFGFTLLRNDPAFIATSSPEAPSEWIIDQLDPAEIKEFSLTGRLKGERDEDKYFKFQVGNIDPSNPVKIITQFVSVDRLVAIKLPFVSSKITLGQGGADQDVVQVGQNLSGVISYRNNLSTDVNDLELILKLKDNNLIQRSGINVGEGFYSSLDNTITWTKQTAERLESVSPGEEGSVNFNLPFIEPSLSALNSGSLKNLMIDMELTIKGKRISDANVPEQIVLLDSKSVKVITEPKIKAQAVYGTGPFINTGGIPPKVNKSTSYTIMWSLSNTLNDISGGVITAKLPPYVKFEGSVSPSSEKVTFNPSTNEVRWEAGTIYAGQGYRSSAKGVAFKIILTPSANQVGTTPSVLQDMHFTGMDSFTNQTVQDDVFDLNTELRQDPTYQYGQDKVIN